MPHFGPSGDVVFHADKDNSTFAFRIHEDGTGQKKLGNNISEVLGVTPDRKYAIEFVGTSGEHNAAATQAVPLAGGTSIPICDRECFLRWQGDGRLLHISVFTGMQSGGAYGRTYAVPLAPGKVFPQIPPLGFHSEAEISALPGVRVIDAADTAPGPTPDVYAFSRQAVQRNLYQIPLP